MSDPNINNIIFNISEELGNDGRILLRESGTEPVVRIMVEGKSEEICEKYINLVMESIDKGGYIS